MPLAYGKVLDDPTLAAIGARLGANPAQVALAWSLAKGYAAIPSSTQRANLAAAQLVLASKDMRRSMPWSAANGWSARTSPPIGIDRAGRLIRPAPGSAGRCPLH
ncbi:MAG: 2,5-diketo-D-gluconate reductase [Massilia sp.]|jgi:diketogulonate reductase-like aldo/keto reductase